MAAIFVSEPGTEYGPCNECEHTDCANLRRQAEAECSACGQPIEYMKRFYITDVGGAKAYAHELCVILQEQGGG